MVCSQQLGNSPRWQHDRDGLGKRLRDRRKLRRKHHRFLDRQEPADEALVALVIVRGIGSATAPAHLICRASAVGTFTTLRAVVAAGRGAGCLAKRPAGLLPV